MWEWYPWEWWPAGSCAGADAGARQELLAPPPTQTGLYYPGGAKPRAPIGPAKRWNQGQGNVFYGSSRRLLKGIIALWGRGVKTLNHEAHPFDEASAGEHS